MKNKSEQSRITLAMGFIATYLTLIIGFAEKIKPSANKFSALNDLFFYIFIFCGIIISLIFFLYLVFTALELSSSIEKEIILEQKISDKKIIKIRKKLFDLGVRLIFISFSFPVYYLAPIFMKNFSPLKAIFLFGLCAGSIEILLSMVLKEKNK